MRGGKCQDAQWRHERAKAGGRASARARWRLMLERTKGMTKPQAFSHGYRTGYQCAYHYWRKWAMKQQAAQNRTAA